MFRVRSAVFVCVLCGTALSLLSVFLLLPRSAHAALYNASAVLGHIDPSGAPLYESGGPNNGPNASGINNPNDVALDTINHRLFVADSQNCRVLVFNLDSENNVVTTTASYVLGQSSFYTNASALSRNGFSCLSNNITLAGLAYDPVSSRLFVSDSANNRVLIFDVSPDTIVNGENAENVLGQSDFTSNAKGIAQNSFGSNSFGGTGGLAYDSANSRLFVSDYNNNRVMIFDVSTSTIVNGENAENVLGQSNFTQNNTTSTTQSSLDFNKYLAFDPDTSRLFVSDDDNQRIMIFDVATSTITNGENAENVLGQANYSANGYGNGTQTGFFFPEGIAVDPASQRVFISDALDNRVLVFDVATSTISDGENAENVLGQATYAGSSATTTQSGLNSPYGIAIDPVSQDLFVADEANSRIMVFDAATSTIANGENASGLIGHADFSGNFLYTLKGVNNGPGPEGFSYAQDAALDPINHRLFVADADNNRVLVFQLDDGDDIATATPSYVLGQPDFTSIASSVAQNRLSSPCDLAYDSLNSRLFVADCDNYRVMVFNVATSTITNGENAENVIGQAGYTSVQYTTAQNRINLPEGIVYDPANSRLFVSDNSSRVLIFDVSIGNISDGENAENVLGQTTYTGFSATTTQSGLSGPNNMAYDALSSRLFVSDYNNNRVMVFNVATSTITNGENAENVLGNSSFASSTSSLSQSGNLLPRGLAYDPDTSDLYVANSVYSRIMIFDASTSTISNGENAKNVLGQPDFVSSIGGTGRNLISVHQGIVASDIIGLAYDPSSHNLFIADGTNNRVLQYSFITLATSTPPSGNAGESYSSALSTSNSQGTPNFSLVSGSLPDGLVLATSTGVISGIPTAATTTSFTVEAGDSFSTGNFSDTEPFTLTINAHPAVISGIAVSSISSSGATVTWDTDVSSTCTVYYGTTDLYGSSVAESASSTSHSVSLSGLAAGALYYYEIEAENSGAVSTSTDKTFSTLPGLIVYVGAGGPPIVNVSHEAPSSTAIASSSAESLSIHALQAQLDLLKSELAALLKEASASGSYPGESPEASAASFSFPRNLSRGMEGQDVRNLQMFLNSYGFTVAETGLGSRGNETDFFGSKTFGALVGFQRAHGLPATGWFGPMTRAEIADMLGN